MKKRKRMMIWVKAFASALIPPDHEHTTAKTTEQAVVEEPIPPPEVTPAPVVPEEE